MPRLGRIEADHALDPLIPPINSGGLGQDAFEFALVAL